MFVRAFLIVCLTGAAAFAESPPASSDEWQARIREESARYQEGVTRRFSYYEIDPLWLRERSVGVLRPLAPGAFASICFSMKEDPAILLSPASNQALQLTTTAQRPEKLFDDLLPFTAFDARYRRP
jgi:hypothetical protein